MEQRFNNVFLVALGVLLGLLSLKPVAIAFELSLNGSVILLISLTIAVVLVMWLWWNIRVLPMVRIMKLDEAFYPDE
jgi:hypothetical protein